MGEGVKFKIISLFCQTGKTAIKNNGKDIKCSQLGEVVLQ